MSTDDVKMMENKRIVTTPDTKQDKIFFSYDIDPVTSFKK